MGNTRDTRDDKVIDHLFGVARTAIGQRLARGLELEDDGLGRLTRAARMPVPAARAHRKVYAASVLLAAASVVLLVMTVSRHRPALEPTLSYTREAGRAADAPTVATTRVRFSDGTTIWAPPDAGVDVENPRQDKPRVRIKGRSTRVHVVHRPDTRWTFLAGPFEVLVTGTTFELGWDPTPQVLSLSLIEGSVTLQGPRLPGGVLAVAAGQRISIALPTGAVSVGQLSLPAPAAAGPGAATSSPLPASESPPTAGEPSSHHRHGESWNDMIRRGEFERVIAAARTRSWRDCETRCSSDELRALGDAARYGNQTALAERAFRALRTRFAPTAHGSAAAYLLGRTYEARKRWGDADRWYATYLREAPAGEFAVEASSGRARAAAHQRKASAPIEQLP